MREATVMEGELAPLDHSLVMGAGNHTLPPERKNYYYIVITNSTTHIFRTKL